MEALPIDIAKIRLTEFFPTEFAVRGNATGQQLAENGIATQFRLTQDLDFTANPALNRVSNRVRSLNLDKPILTARSPPNFKKPKTKLPVPGVSANLPKLKMTGF